MLDTPRYINRGHFLIAGREVLASDNNNDKQILTAFRTSKITDCGFIVKSATECTSCELRSRTSSCILRLSRLFICRRESGHHLLDATATFSKFLGGDVRWQCPNGRSSVCKINTPRPAVPVGKYYICQFKNKSRR